MSDVRIPLIGLLAALVLLVPAASASAALVPPGNSAATQYSETVPSAGGEETSPKAGGESSGGKKAAGGESAVPAATAAELERLGPEGEAALRLAKQGAPPSKSRGSHRKEGGAMAMNPGTPRGPSSGSGGLSGVGEVLGGAAGTSSRGLGFLQPLILATVLIGAGAYLLRRRRSGSAGQADSAQR